MSVALKTLAARWPGPGPGTSRARGVVVLVGCCSQASLTSCRERAPLHHQTSSRFNHSKAGPTRLASRPRPTAIPTPASRIASAARRFASATPPTPAAASSVSTSPSTSTATAPSKPALDWESFFKLRVRRRRIQLGFSISLGLLGGATGAVLLSTGLAEPLVMQVPLDPFFTLGLMTMACASMGWLAGPSVGNQVFYVLNRHLKAQMMEKESEFFTRVRKNRVDPSNSSAGNPVPDFYGEKVQSVSGYRRWLKDQQAFNKKKTANFV